MSPFRRFFVDITFMIHYTYIKTNLRRTDTMKYRDLNISFTIENTRFTILSLVSEQLIRPIPMHAHSKNSYELHYVAAGEGLLNSGGEQYHIQPGTVFMTGPGVEHEQISDPENPLTKYCVYLKAEQKGRPQKKSLAEKFTGTLFWISYDGGSLRSIINSAFGELEGSMLGRELMIESLMLQLILTVIRLYESGKASAGNAPERRPSTEHSYLIIEDAFLYDYKTITLESLSKKLGLGTRQTERLLKEHYNKTFQQKKTESRMFAARTLLRESLKSIGEIAEELGYSSCEHFSWSFKKYCGMSPSEYRRSRG